MHPIFDNLKQRKKKVKERVKKNGTKESKQAKTFPGPPINIF